MTEKKVTAILVALSLMLSMGVSLVALPVANAQARYKVYPFVSAMPNPVGVGQETLLYIGVVTLAVRPQNSWNGLTVEVTKPDGTTEVLGPFNTDYEGALGLCTLPIR